MGQDLVLSCGLVPAGGGQAGVGTVPRLLTLVWCVHSGPQVEECGPHGPGSCSLAIGRGQVLSSVRPLMLNHPALCNEHGNTDWIS